MGTAADVIAGLKQPEGNITVNLRGGHTLEFRRVSDANEYLSIGTQARRFSKMLASKPSAAFAPYADVREEVAIACFWIHKLAVAPEFSQLDALELAKVAGAAVLLVFNTIMTECAGVVVETEQEAMDALGEGFEPTASGGTT